MKNEQTVKATKAFLMRGSIHEIEIKNACEGQIAVYKNKLLARKRIQARGSITTFEAL